MTDIITIVYILSIKYKYIIIKKKIMLYTINRSSQKGKYWDIGACWDITRSNYCRYERTKERTNVQRDHNLVVFKGY
jgi:hypothetical protein